MTDTVTLHDDLLTGAQAIAAHLGWDVRRVYHSAEKKYLPIGKCGQTLIARKSELDRALSPASAGAMTNG